MASTGLGALGLAVAVVALAVGCLLVVQRTVGLPLVGVRAPRKSSCSTAAASS